MATSNGFLHSDPPSASPMLPPWLSNSNGSSTVGPPSPSVALTLSPAMGPIPWLQPERTDNGLGLGNLHSLVSNAETLMVSELAECCRELEEGHRLWVAHKKETAWRLRRVELQLESEKANRRREKMEEIELKVRALREEQKASLEMIDAEYKEQILGLKRDAEVKEQKLVEQWAARHARLVQFLEQMGCRQRRVTEQTGK